MPELFVKGVAVKIKTRTQESCISKGKKYDAARRLRGRRPNRFYIEPESPVIVRQDTPTRLNGEILVCDEDITVTAIDLDNIDRSSSGSEYSDTEDVNVVGTLVRTPPSRTKPPLLPKYSITDSSAEDFQKTRDISAEVERRLGEEKQQQEVQEIYRKCVAVSKRKISDLSLEDREVFESQMMDKAQDFVRKQVEKGVLEGFSCGRT